MTRVYASLWMTVVLAVIWLWPRAEAGQREQPADAA